MKKTITTLAVLLGLTLGGYAQGGLFQKGAEPERGDRSTSSNPMMPNQHGYNGDVNGDGTTPLGSGVAVLLGLGAAYLVGKRRKEE